MWFFLLALGNSVVGLCPHGYGKKYLDLVTSYCYRLDILLPEKYSPPEDEVKYPPVVCERNYRMTTNGRCEKLNLPTPTPRPIHFD